MGKYTRKCSGVAEVAVMEVAQAGMKTRGRAMAMAAEEDADSSGSVKRMKVVGNGELRLSSSNSVRITANESGDVITTLKNYADSVGKDLRELSGDAISGDVQAACCSSNGSITEKQKSADLEVRTEVATTMRFKLDGRESTPTSEFKAESGELESTKTAKPSRRPIPEGKAPPAAELKEFFAAAEENLHKCFKEKYNFDIVNEVPLKGRFEWVQLKP